MNRKVELHPSQIFTNSAYMPPLTFKDNSCLLDGRAGGDVYYLRSLGITRRLAILTTSG